MKERLVGAAVLVAIGVWLIPWVLDGPEDAVDSGGSSLQLPAAEEPMPMRTQTLRVGAAADESTVADAVPPAVPAPVAADTAPVATEAAATAEAAEPQAAPPPVVPAPKTPPAATPVVRAPAAPAAKGDWLVQLGSFGSEDNARRLAQRAGTFGYKASVSNVRSGGRTMYRVRVGPFESRGQADATASALAAHGLAGQVVAAD